MNAITENNAALTNFISQLMGTVGKDVKIHSSQFALMGDTGTFFKLPAMAAAPIQQQADGAFRFMVDYDAVDNGNPVY